MHHAPLAAFGAPEVLKGRGVRGGVPRGILMLVGLALLLLLCIIPVWNAFALMFDDNYIFWAGVSVPVNMLGVCAGVFILYVLVTLALLYSGRSQLHQRLQLDDVLHDSAALLVGNLFITVLGLALMLISMPLASFTHETYDNLMHHCDYSDATHRLYETSQNLHALRRMPACKELYSVEDCAGFQEVAVYTRFLKTVEEEFRCSGFCIKKMTAPAGLALATAAQMEDVQRAADKYSKDLEDKREPVPVVYPISEDQNIRTGQVAEPGVHPKEESPNRHLFHKIVPLNVQAGPPQPPHHQDPRLSWTGAGLRKESYDVTLLETGGGPVAASVSAVQLLTSAMVLSGQPEAPTSLTRNITGPTLVSHRYDDAAASRLVVPKDVMHPHSARYQYPPTLFSDSNYKASCEGMMARDMRHFAGDIAFQSFFQGLFLVTIGVIMGFLKLVSFCKGHDKTYKRP